MKIRKSMHYFVAVLMACSALYSSAARKDERTLLMVPREEETVRLGMDIANRYPTLLLSYVVGVNNSISLHGWTGSEWVNIAVDAFHSGDFFRKGPDSALIVEKAGAPVPGKLLPPAGWCANASKITTTEMRPLLHLVGQYYDFSFKEWQWFAKRYSMDMDAINPEGLNVAWYHKRMSEHLKSSGQQGASDLQYWVSIRQSAAESVASLGPEQPEDPPAVDVPENMLTNDAPKAVIMGAADADEEHAEDEEHVEDADKDEGAEIEEEVHEEREMPPPTDEAAVEEQAPEHEEEME